MADMDQICTRISFNIANLSQKHVPWETHYLLTHRYCICVGLVRTLLFSQVGRRQSMEAIKAAAKKNARLSGPLLQVKATIQSVLSHWSRAARGAWRRNVTRYLVKRRGLEKSGPSYLGAALQIVCTKSSHDLPERQRLGLQVHRRSPRART